MMLSSRRLTWKLSFTSTPDICTMPLEMRPLSVVVEVPKNGGVSRGFMRSASRPQSVSLPAAHISL